MLRASTHKERVVHWALLSPYAGTKIYVNILDDQFVAMPVFRNSDYKDPGHHRNPRMATAGIQENFNFMFEYAAFALTIRFISFALYKLIPIVVVLLLSWALSMALAYFYIYILATIIWSYQSLRSLKKKLIALCSISKPHDS